MRYGDRGKIERRENGDETEGEKERGREGRETREAERERRIDVSRR